MPADIEAQVVGRISEAVKARFPDAFVANRAVAAPPQFPCVSVAEMDNFSTPKAQTLSSTEEMSTLVYEIQIFSNKEVGAKAECREIREITDHVMQELWFTRTLSRPVPNTADVSITRMVSRYTKQEDL